RVLPLGHGGVAIDAPRKDSQQACPGDLPVLHEKPRRVVDMLDELSVALVRHGYRYGRTRTSCPLLTNSPPTVTMRSPIFTPLVTSIELPNVWPTETCCAAT